MDCLCDKKWLCAECFKQAFNLDDEFDWRKVGIIYFRCHKCGDEPVIFLDYPEINMEKEDAKEISSNAR